MEKRIHAQTITGTGANITVTCGFRPKYIKVINKTGLATLEFVEPDVDADEEAMAAGYGFKILTGIDDTADTASLMSVITTKGITLSNNGYVIGADTDINVEDEILETIAFR